MWSRTALAHAGESARAPAAAPDADPVPSRSAACGGSAGAAGSLHVCPSSIPPAPAAAVGMVHAAVGRICSRSASPCRPGAFSSGPRRSASALDDDASPIVSSPTDDDTSDARRPLSTVASAPPPGDGNLVPVIPGTDGGP